MADGILGLAQLAGGIPSEEERLARRRGGALTSIAGGFQPTSTGAAIAQGVIRGAGIQQEFSADEQQAARMAKTQEIIQEHLALQQQVEQLEFKAKEAKQAKDTIDSVAPSIAGAFNQFTANGNTEMLRSNLSAIAESILQRQGTSLQSLDFANNNPTQIIVRGKDGSVTPIDIFQVANVMRRSNPTMADALLANLGGFNPLIAQGQQAREASLAFGGTQEEAQEAALVGAGVAEPIERVETAGPGGFAAPTKPVETQLQQKVLTAQDASVRLKRIQSTFDPELLTIGADIKGFVLSGLDKISPKLLDVAESAGIENPKAFLTKQTEFVQNAIENLNLYIKEITGAQMSEAEAGRLRRAVPDPDEDSPTQFKTKLDNSILVQDAVAARAQFALANGIALNPDGSFDVERLASEIAIPSTTAEFEVIPAGAMFVNPADGRVMRKQ